MTGPAPEPPTPMAAGFRWASRIAGLGIELAVPTLAGLAVDRFAGSSPWGILIGATIGFAVGMFHLLKIAREGSRA